VLVCNHVSFVDALVIGGFRRPIRFVMDHRIFRWPVLSFVFRHSRAIPSPRQGRPGDDGGGLRRSLGGPGCRRAGRPVPEGSPLMASCALPPGIARILEANPVAGHPHGAARPVGQHVLPQGWPGPEPPLRRGLFNRIELVVGPALPPETVSLPGLQVQVASLRGDWK
jgi:1-acyl-sn-glycerol-3-phosphate acyltransferase